jgi:multiple sugar transport system substrate-binding protein
MPEQVSVEKNREEDMSVLGTKDLENRRGVRGRWGDPPLDGSGAGAGYDAVLVEPGDAGHRAQAMRDTVLPDFGTPVDFQPQDPGAFMTRIQAELGAGKGQIAVIGGLHGEFSSFPDGLSNLNDVLQGVGAEVAYAELGTLGTTEQKYVPWMQATYIMAANKQALQYLPQGADLNALTYDQLIAWAKALAEGTGGPKFGLPAGPKGLIHRFVQGTLYPSFTDSMVTKFRSAEAEAMWEKMKELWAVTIPSSPSYDFMQDPLLSGEVWLAWDHVARLSNAFNEKPDDFHRLPLARWSYGARLHARGRRPRRADLGSRPGRLQAAGRLHDAAGDAAEDAPGDQLLPGRSRRDPGGHAELREDRRTRDRRADDLSGGQPRPPARRPWANSAASSARSTPTPSSASCSPASRCATSSTSKGQTLKALMEQAKAPCWAPDAPSQGPCPVE